MTTCKERISTRTAGIGTAISLGLLLAGGSLARATDYIFNLTTGTATWATTTAWTPNGTPGTGDNIDATLITSSGATLSLNGTVRTINNLTKTVASRWNISGGASTLSTLNLNNITLATDNMIFFNGASGGLVVNAANMTVNTGGILYFGSTSLSANNMSRGLTVSGTTTLNGTGALRMNVSNTTGNSYSLGLLNVNGTAIATLNNAPAGKAASVANVTGLSGSGGSIQAVLAISEYGVLSTLAINNTTDYSSATVLRDGALTTNGGTLLVTKTGAGIQTLTGANTYTGATTISNGILRMGNASALGARAGILPGNVDTGTSVSATGTLDLGGQTGVIEVIRLNGTGFGGNGALVNTGAAASIGNGVASITQTAAGSVPATLSFSGGGGTGTTGTVSLGVTAATFAINGGTTTYSAAPAVTISGGGGSGATATANLNASGVVSSITITSPGFGFATVPTIGFSAGTVLVAGTNPSGMGNATSFTPVSYSITATGSGYTSAPTVSFSDGTFAATAALSGIVLTGNASIGGSGNITVDGMVSEEGGAWVLTKVGTNVLALTNAGNSYSGGTIINGGSISIATDTALGTAPGTATAAHLTLNGGTLATTGDVALAATRGLSLGASGGTFDVASSTTLSYDGSAAGAGGLTKSGTGTLALSGGSSYAGATAANAGTLAISNDTALGTTAGGVTVASGATLQLSGGITVGEEALSLTGDGAVAGAGALQNLSGGNTWNGDVTITAGATRINSDAGSLLITGDVALVGTTGNFNVGGAGDVEISGLISGGLQLFKSSVGGGTVTLSNPNNTYTNHTTVAAGTLRISTEGNLGTTPAVFSSVKLRVRSGGTLQTTADMSISANRGITISNGGGAISPDAGTTLTVNSRITGTAADTLAKAGAGKLVLTADNGTFLGATDVTSGALQAGLGGAGKTGTGAITVRTGGSLLGTGIVQGSSFTAESGSFVHAGDGTAQGDYGTLTFTPVSGAGAIDFQIGSTLVLGLNAAGMSDLLSFIGTGSTLLSFSGDLIAGPSSLVPTQETTFNLLDWSGLGAAPTFASRYSHVGLLFGNGDEAAGLDLPDVFGSGYGWDISSFTTDGSISLVLVPEPCRCALLALGAGLLLARRPERRRKQSCVRTC